MQTKWKHSFRDSCLGGKTIKKSEQETLSTEFPSAGEGWDMKGRIGDEDFLGANNPFLDLSEMVSFEL